ncbi:hypothetical protein ABBQ32_005608 [Trebouxia sp. C0010 RCD-2024]
MQKDQCSLSGRVCKPRQEQQVKFLQLLCKFRMRCSEFCWQTTTKTTSGTYFRLMELPQPEADELGRPILSVTSTDISRAYRRISVLVHPDKNPGEDARKAFEALNEAHRKLKDPGQMEEILKVAAEAAIQRREAAEASATPDERIAIQHAKAARAKELRKKETANFQAEIMRQQQQKKEATKRKRMLASRSRLKHHKDDHSTEQADEDGDEDDDDHKPVVKRRGKPKFMF